MLTNGTTMWYPFDARLPTPVVACTLRRMDVSLSACGSPSVGAFALRAGHA
jgi:hypothetical protein